MPIAVQHAIPPQSRRMAIRR